MARGISIPIIVCIAAVVLISAIARGAGFAEEPRGSWSINTWEGWSEYQKGIFVVGFFFGWIASSTSMSDIAEGAALDKCVQSLKVSPKELVAIVDKEVAAERWARTASLDIVFFFALARRCGAVKE